MAVANVLVYSKHSSDLPRFARLLVEPVQGATFAFAGSPGEAEPYLARTDVLYGWGFPVTMLSQMPRLRWVQKMGAGAEDLVADWPRDRRILLTRTDGKLIAPRMVEYVVHAVLDWTLRLRIARQLRTGRRWEHFESGSVRDHTIGIAGLGEIGSEVAQALSHLGARVIGWNRTGREVPAVERVFCGVEQLPAFASQCSVVVLVLPLTTRTRRLFNAKRFAAFCPDTLFVNVGRGGVVDEDALLDALQSGRVGHAALDVFEMEPLPSDHPFWSHPRVTLTPHMSGPLIPEDVVRHFIANLTAFQAGEALCNIVDIERQY